MKIIEFGMDDDASASGRAVKAKTSPPAPTTRSPADATAVRFVKIKEFGKESDAAGPEPAAGRRVPAPAVPAPGAIKVVEFGKESAPQAAPRRSGMKIIEFD